MKTKIKQFWKDIIYKDGKLDEEQVMKELADFYFIMQEVPKVYCEITGGLLSKLKYPAEVVIREFNERFWDKEITKDDVVEILKSKQADKDKLQEIKEYLEI